MDQKLEKMENKNLILYSDGTLEEKPKKPKLKKRQVWGLIFLTILLFLGFYIVSNFFLIIGEYGSGFYKTQKNNYLLFVASFLLFVGITNFWAFKKITSRKKLISSVVGLNFFFGVFIIFFTHAFCISSMPAASVVSLCWALRPWWRPFNIFFALIPATIIGLCFFFGTQQSFENE